MRLACVLLLLVMGTAHADKPRPLAKATTPVLSGRLILRLPDGAKLQARQRSLMAAEEAADTETRAVLDAEKARFVMMVYELGQLGGPDFEKAARAEIKGATFEPLAVAAPLKALGFVPPAPDGSSEANLVYGAFVQHPDGTVQQLAFYVSPPGLPALARWTDLGRRVSASLVVGPRALALEGGKRKLGDELAVTLPAGWSTSAQDGPDFTVHHLNRLTPLGAPVETCGVYVGGHPGALHQQSNVPEASVTSTPGVLLGGKTTWKSWALKGRACVEAVAPFPSQANLFVHAFCCASTLEKARALRPVVDSLSAK